MPTTEHPKSTEPLGDRDHARRVWLLRALGWSALPLAVLLLFREKLGIVLSSELYLPLHTLLEILVVVVCLSTFAVQWYAAGTRGLKDARARFLGAAFLAIAMVETLHILVFPGMPSLPGLPSNTSRGIYYWISARILFVLALPTSALLDPLSDRLSLRRGPLAVAAVALALVITGLDLLVPGASQVFFAEGGGLTSWAKGLDAFVAVAAALGAVVYWKRYTASDERTMIRIAAALVVTVLSQICFTLYTAPTDTFNLLGHVYQALAYALVFDALFVAALLRPYRKLDATTRELSASNAELKRLRKHIEEELAGTIARLEESTEERRRALAALEAAIAAVPDGIIFCSAAGQVLRWNAACDRILGYTEEVRALPLLERWKLLRPRTPDRRPISDDEIPMRRALAGETVEGFLLELQPPGRKPVWASVSAAPIRDPEGRILGGILALADVSTVLRLQEQREDLLRAVSHDLRNPLQVVLLQAERLQKLTPDPAARERRVADSILAATRQMREMIQDLVDSARLEAGSLKLARQPVVVEQYLARFLAVSAEALDLQRVRLEIPPSLPSADADPARLDRIFLNLLGNALKYSGPGPVSIRAGQSGRELTLSVSDTGPGIPQEELPRLFERYFRGSTQRGEGMGLGLYITRLLVEAHGGRIWAESKPGEGSTFCFTLPACKGEAPGTEIR